MPKLESLDELISRKAQEFSDQIISVAAMADKEEEIRIAAEKQLAFIEKEAGIKLEGRHEFTVASGRIDSVYDRVIIEYKNPSSASARIGPGPNSPGAKKVVEQIKKRFYDLKADYGQPMNSLFGVGLDGNHFIFVRFRDNKWHVQDPVEVTKHSAERFLWALFNLGSKGKPFSPDYLAGDFGSESALARQGIGTLYKAISQASHPQALTFFKQWKILFGEVCGYDVDNPSDKIKKLADFYGAPTQKLKPAELLFSVHTYYALFIKFLAAEIMTHFHKLPSILDKMMQAGSTAKLKRELEELEKGGIFANLNITNFLEGDLFAWYLPEWSNEIEGLIRDMVARLDNYNPGSLSEDPAGSRDLLKKLYQQLFPKSVRHDLGEYYTPDWLAEHVLNELEYVGDPDKRILDPACGSGTFLVLAINKIKQWYDKHREECRFDEGELCKKILTNVVGFDLNPLAVMAARTNYLIAIRDLIHHVDRVEIPIYLCDSILTPSEYGNLFAGHGKARELKTAATTFLIPTEITQNRDDVARYAEQLDFCVRNGYSPKEFIERCQEEGLPVEMETLHTDLYNELVKLDKANKNGVWARIIKNAFAPLFVGTFDYVAGNPPWVNWRNLPQDYRLGLTPLWDHYGLFVQRGLKARLGSGMDDISVLMTYVSADVFLGQRGKLGFVITQTLFQSAGGGQGFRKLRLPSGIFLKIEKVHDFSALQPFEGATNRTATFNVALSSSPTHYPVEYWVAAPKKGPPSKSAAGDSKFVDFLETEKEASPISSDPSSPWSVLPKGMSRIVPNVLGTSKYSARIGAHSGGAAGVFWIDIAKMGKNACLISNRWDAGRNKYDPVTASVESKFIRWLIRGRDVNRWTVNPTHHILIPYDEVNDGKAVSEARMRREFPKTFDYFRRFRKELLSRPHYKQHFERLGAPYWSMYNVGNYTFAPARVVWREQTSSFRCAVVLKEDDVNPVADAKLIVVACRSAEEAFYLSALLNSSPARLVIDSYVVKIQISTHVLGYLNVPTYSEKTKSHRVLSDLARRCHEAARLQDDKGVRGYETEIDGIAAQIWGIDTKQLGKIHDHVSESVGDYSDAGDD